MRKCCTITVDQLIRSGQKYTVFAQCDAAAIVAPETFSFVPSSSIGFESASLAGEGLIQKSGDSYTYNYFLKGHLGSTRMVLNEDGGIKEALMYQPYGTVSDVDGMVDGSTDPLREKFTGITMIYPNPSKDGRSKNTRPSACHSFRRFFWHGY